MEFIPLSTFFDPIAIGVILVPVLGISALFWLDQKISPLVVFRDLGVPVGLLYACVGSHGLLQYARDPEIIGPATAIMLLTILYGGILAATAHFFMPDSALTSDSNRLKRTTWLPTSLSLLLFCVVTVYLMDAAAGLDVFINMTSIGVFMALAVLILVRGPAHWKTKLPAQACLFAAMLCLMAGLIQLYTGMSSTPTSAMYSGMALAMTGLVNGLCAYITFYILSYRFGFTEKINAPLMNWHWIEVSAFLVFMFFAPQTLRELLIG